jgi:hypothetical protein
MADPVWKSKLRRARHHARDLQVALREYSQLDPFELVTGLEGNDLVVRVHIRHEIPEDLSLITGDLLHNARSALDLLVTSVAKGFAFNSGRELSSDDERKLSFPVTRTESEFNHKAKRIAPFLPDVTMHQIRIMQPWSIVEGMLEHEGIEISPSRVDTYIWWSPLLRLSTLDNLDKHREVLSLSFHSATITLGDNDFNPLDEGREPEGESLRSFDQLDPETRENLMQSILEMQEHDNRPGSYDFYFSGGELYDGAEVGRYIRHDRGQMPDGLTARGNLRLVLWEPEVMEQFRGSPPLQKTVCEMIDEVERVCKFIERGYSKDIDQSAELYRPRRGLTAEAVYLSIR